MAWSKSDERKFARLIQERPVFENMVVEDDGHVTVWKTVKAKRGSMSPEERQRWHARQDRIMREKAEERTILGRIEEDTLVEQFARMLESTTPYDITGEDIHA